MSLLDFFKPVDSASKKRKQPADDSSSHQVVAPSTTAASIALCPTHKTALVSRTVRKPGPDHGRAFLVCSDPPCEFKVWADGAGGDGSKKAGEDSETKDKPAPAPAAADDSSSGGGSSLTAEQRERMAKNREAAMQRQQQSKRRKLEEACEKEEKKDAGQGADSSDSTATVAAEGSGGSGSGHTDKDAEGEGAAENKELKEVKEKPNASDKERKGEGEYFDAMETHMHDSWLPALKKEFGKSYFAELKTFLNKQHKEGKQIYPPRDQIFAAFKHCPFDRVRVVIIGQDPYHGPKQAEGLCFSVARGVAVPRSLKNIYKELNTDVPPFREPAHGSLMHWAQQGVLLLNACLTVTRGQANSHANKGWEKFTDAVIDVLNKEKSNLVFVLWGGYAQKKGKKLNSSKHYVLQSGHPSPLSEKKFFGCKHFSKTNTFLRKRGLPEINWQLPP